MSRMSQGGREEREQYEQKKKEEKTAVEKCGEESSNYHE